MTKLKVLIFILLFAFGCDYSGSQHNAKNKSVSIDQLIAQNKNRFLFLSFWDGMSEQEFNQILKYENEKGNLSNGKFLLMTTSVNSIPFEVSFDDFSITLTYKDVQWANYSGNSFDAFNEIQDGKSYDYIEKTIIDLFDNKYQRLNPIKNKKDLKKPDLLKEIEDEVAQFRNENEHNLLLQWKTTNAKTNRVISLSSTYRFLVKDFNAKTSPSGATSKFYHDKENKKIKNGECSIYITYEFLDEYLKRQAEQETREIEQKKLREQERKEIEKLIENNNSNL